MQDGCGLRDCHMRVVKSDREGEDRHISYMQNQKEMIQMNCKIETYRFKRNELWMSEDDDG